VIVAVWILVALGAIVGIVGGAIFVQLRRASRSVALLAYLKWGEDWAESKWVRYQAREVVPFKPEHPASLVEEDYRSMNNAISALSNLEYLLQKRLLNATDVLTSAHSEILRSSYATKEYRAHRESQIGSRYGRRLDELESRARRFHYVRKKHRHTAVVWQTPDGDIEIVPPLRSSGVGWTQRAIFVVRGWLHLY
jgi:hypothetical protein